MKVDRKTGCRYAHTPDEWAEVLRKQGAGISLPASLAARLGLAFKKPAAPDQSTDSGSKKDE